MIKPPLAVILTLFAGCVSAAGTTPAYAEEDGSLSGILSGSYQTADESDVEDEASAQTVIEGTLPMGPGSWNLEVKGNTSPREGGVSSAIPEANALIGGTLDDDGDGRFAVTQIYYQALVAGGTGEIGLIDAARLIDTNDVANDEFTQFMNTTLVNNPTLEAPASALGVNYSTWFSDHFGVVALVSSSADLEDEDHSYGNVVDVNDGNEGVFSALEAQWRAGGLTGNVAIWTNTSDHATFTDATADESNYGVFTNVSGAVAAIRWNLRAGVANEEVSPAANFVSAALDYTLPRATVGLGVSRTGPSDELPGDADAIIAAELYTRLQVTQHFYVTPDVQWIRHSDFNPEEDSTWVAGLRVGRTF